MDNYEVRVAEIERKKAERQADIKRVIHEYTTFVMTEFLSKEDLEILHENIEYFAHGQSDLYKPIRSKVDNSPPFYRPDAFRMEYRGEIGHFSYRQSNIHTYYIPT